MQTLRAVDLEQRLKARLRGSLFSPISLFSRLNQKSVCGFPPWLDRPGHFSDISHWLHHHFTHACHGVDDERDEITDGGVGLWVDFSGVDLCSGGEGRGVA